MWHIHAMEYNSAIQKKWSTVDTWYSVNESQKHYAKQKESDTEEHVFMTSFMWNSRISSEIVK